MRNFSNSISQGRKFCVLAGTAVLVLASIGIRAAEAEDVVNALKQKGTITSGVANEAPWMIVGSDGSLSGVGPEVDREALAATGVSNSTAQVMDYGAMIPALQAGRVDIISSGALFIKPARCEQVIYSEPVVCNSEGFMMKKTLQGKIQSYKDVADANLRIGVCGGCSEQRFATEAGVSPQNMVIFPDGVSALKMLQDDRIDLFALPDASLEALQKQSSDANLEVVFPVKGTPIGCGGAAFKKEDVALRDLYNQGLAKIVANGQYATIMAKYGLASHVRLREGQTTAALCSASQ
ncbi:MAG: ectoine/hydroxyectoine ABC transporter substrate-binding protein EhuB [Mesorhizobium sp.]|nr:MAG: ectoine/hydroxyectoine ABC transporter substrate-binding protein EhuB [Mesorhizobium sp.]